MSSLPISASGLPLYGPGNLLAGAASQRNAKTADRVQSDQAQQKQQADEVELTQSRLGDGDVDATNGATVDDRDGDGRQAWHWSQNPSPDSADTEAASPATEELSPNPPGHIDFSV